MPALIPGSKFNRQGGSILNRRRHWSIASSLPMLRIGCRWPTWPASPP